MNAILKFKITCSKYQRITGKQLPKNNKITNHNRLKMTVEICDLYVYNCYDSSLLP